MLLLLQLLQVLNGCSCQLCQPCCCALLLSAAADVLHTWPPLMLLLLLLLVCWPHGALPLAYVFLTVCCAASMLGQHRSGPTGSFLLLLQWLLPLALPVLILFPFLLPPLLVLLPLALPRLMLLLQLLPPLLLLLLPETNLLLLTPWG